MVNGNCLRKAFLPVEWLRTSYLSWCTCRSLLFSEAHLIILLRSSYLALGLNLQVFVLALIICVSSVKLLRIEWRIQLGVAVVDKNQKKYWSEHCALGNFSQDQCGGWEFTIDNRALLTAYEESFYRVQDASLKTIALHGASSIGDRDPP